MFKMFYPYEYVESVFVIDYEKLYENGYRGIIFDIDNTLVHHGEDSTPEIDSLFEKIHCIGFKTVMLSNNSARRIEKFLENINSKYVAEANKPNVKGYFKALKLIEEDKEKVVCIGDQLFTDIYGANKCNIPSILVAFLRKEGETKIGKKRMLEKIILKAYRRSKGYQYRLGNIKIEGAKEYYG